VVRGSGTGSWSSRPRRSRSVLRGKSTTTYASSKLNRVGRRAARYDSGLSAHRCNRPAHKRLTPHRIAYGQIACSRSRCGNLTTLHLSPVNPHSQTLSGQPTLEHNHARYDSFGKLTASTGSLVNSFRYTGREFDTETGLYYSRARYYDPNSSRFLSEDPIGFDGALNSYAYVDNDPEDYDDPFGLQKYKCSIFGPCIRIPRGRHRPLRPIPPVPPVQEVRWWINNYRRIATVWQKALKGYKIPRHDRLIPF